MNKSICVFAGSSLGVEPLFARIASDLGRELVTRGYGLVYGGACVGLMGVVADTVLECGGHVTGVIPEFLVDKEIAHRRLSDLKLVSSMHERKDMMAHMSDGFVALPGGFGTVEEFFEVLTWAQLGLHAKPCGLLNVGDYYGGVLRFLDDAVRLELLKPANRSMVLVEHEPRPLLDRFESYTAPVASKWIRAEVT